MNNLKILQTCLALLSLFFFQSAQAQVNWDGGAGTNNWGDAMNWDTDLVPTGADDVVIDAGFVSMSTTTYFARSLTLTNGASLDITSSATLSMGGSSSYSVVIDGSQFILNGTLNISGAQAGVSVSTPGSIFLGLGTFSISDYAGYGLIVNSGCIGCVVENYLQWTFDHGSGAGVNAIQVAENGSIFANYGTIDIGQNTNMGGGIGTGFSSSIINNHGVINIYKTGSGRTAFMHNFFPGTLNNLSGALVTLGSGLDGAAFVSGFNFNLINNGTIELDKAGAADVMLSGTGTFTGLETFSNVNSIAPGNSPGCINFDNGLSHTGTTAKTAIEIGGTTPCSGHDRINVTGTATIGGTLNITLHGGFTPTAGETYTILQADAISGTYATINYPTVSGITWTTTYNATSIVANANATLPVELTRFDAKKQGAVVDLNWSTATEIDNKGFEVQRSTRSGAWETIGFVEGNGDQVIEMNYNLVDRNPRTGTNYYRLQQIDYDGATEYSKVVSVEFFNNADVSVFPNPATTSFQLSGDNLEGSIIRIMDAAGSRFYEAVYNGQSVSVEGFQTGMYVVEIVNSDRPLVKRLMVK